MSIASFPAPSHMERELAELRRFLYVDNTPKISKKQIRLHNGQPALWERGGGMTNTGHATIIAGPDGERLKPLLVRRRGHLACGNHALLPISQGCYVIHIHYWRKTGFSVTIYRINSISKEEERAEAVLVGLFEGGRWVYGFPAKHLIPAIKAGIEKATCYHCREPHYVLT